MTRSHIHRLAAAVILTAAVSVFPARAQPRADSLHLLDVPYLPQSELLCGGAAIAMVMRYWGASNVYAETFADLVDPAAGGIRGADLLRALRSREWTAESFRGDRSGVQVHLSARRPVVALIQDRPGRFHYVVVVGWSSGRVIVHDPARAPFRIIDEQAFDTAWSASGYWTLAASPPVSTTPDSALRGREPRPDGLATPRANGADTPCNGMVTEGVRLAGTGDVAGARRLFEFATENCPGAAGPFREMAGLHALVSDWPAAAADARKALDRDPADALAARILATALYLGNDGEGALAAWNLVGEPIIDLVNITGLERTRYGVAAGAMALGPQHLLTKDALRAARRRLSELPAAQTTRVGFRPGENGRAHIDAVVLERPLLPTSPVALAAVGLRAMTDRDLSISLASPTGGGELWTVSWRWWERRPRIAVGLDAPAPFGGVWGVTFFDERQTYDAERAPLEEARRRAAFSLSRWTMSGVRWEGTVALDRLRETGMHSGGQAFAIGAAAERRFAGDRASAEVRAGSWVGGVRTWTLTLRAEWRSQSRHEGHVWIARAGEDLAGADAPLALWSGAGTGQGRDLLLRAHPLLEDGILRQDVLGRRLISGGVEWRRWVRASRQPVRLAPAVFLDFARASRGFDAARLRGQFDAGAGLRLTLPGAGVLRIDAARGLRDGRHALSVGWTK